MCHQCSTLHQQQDLLAFANSSVASRKTCDSVSQEALTVLKQADGQGRADLLHCCWFMQLCSYAGLHCALLLAPKAWGSSALVRPHRATGRGVNERNHTSSAPWNTAAGKRKWGCGTWHGAWGQTLCLSLPPQTQEEPGFLASHLYCSSPEIKQILTLAKIVK